MSDKQLKCMSATQSVYTLQMQSKYLIGCLMSKQTIVGLYAVTVSTAQRHPYDGYHTCTVGTLKKNEWYSYGTDLPCKKPSSYGRKRHLMDHMAHHVHGVSVVVFALAFASTYKDFG